MVEPEIMLMFKDKLKVSDLGYQLEGGKNVWSCKLGDQPFAALCIQTTAVLGQYAGSSGDRSGLQKRKQIRAFMQQSFSVTLLQLSSARS